MSAGINVTRSLHQSTFKILNDQASWWSCQLTWKKRRIDENYAKKRCRYAQNLNPELQVCSLAVTIMILTLCSLMKMRRDRWDHQSSQHPPHHPLMNLNHSAHCAPHSVSLTLKHYFVVSTSQHTFTLCTFKILPPTHLSVHLSRSLLPHDLSSQHLSFFASPPIAFLSLQTQALFKSKCLKNENFFNRNQICKNGRICKVWKWLNRRWEPRKWQLAPECERGGQGVA